jgi:uncharacterized protein YdaU (DUF1376 family)
MAALPYIQLFVADYLADTMHLSASEHGAYLLLIMNYWQTGKPLLNDDARLAKICRMNFDEWQQSRDTILAFFSEKRGYLHHKRIDSDLERVNSKSTKASEAGKISGKQRKRNERSTNVQRTFNECSSKNERPLIYTYTDTEADTEADTNTEADTEEKTPAPEKPKTLPIGHEGRAALIAVVSEQEIKDALKKPVLSDGLYFACEVMARNRGQPVNGKSWIESVRTAHENLSPEQWYIGCGGILWLLDAKPGKYNGDQARVRVEKYQKAGQKAPKMAVNNNLKIAMEWANGQ